MAQYELVSTGTTGHAELVQIIFDPAQISYGEILRIFFTVATDPTQVNMQFPDEGPQYRGEIFYTTPDQKRVAEAYIKQLNDAHVFRKPIATRVDPAEGLLQGRGLPPGLPDPAPEPAVHRHLRHPQGGRAARGVPGPLPRQPTLVFPTEQAKAAKPAKTAKAS